MRILQITPQIPYPLLDGGKVGIFNITKHLALRGHAVTMATFQRSTDTADLTPLKDLCELVTVPHSTENSVPRALLNLFSGLPYNVAKYHSRRLLELVATLVKVRKFDVVHVDHLHMATYGLFSRSLGGPPVVLREHNVESMIMERFAESQGPGPLGFYLRRQLRRIRKHEARMARLCDTCCVISDEDRERLLALEPKARIRVIPGGIDAGYFAPAPSPDQPIPYSVCFFGSLDWIANRDAVLWFLDDIFPRVLALEPRACFYIVGKGVPPEIGARAGRNVILRGFVADLRAELSRYTVSAVPIRIGSGIRLKILESFAMRLPVVATRVGREGIEAEDGRHLLVADEPQEFAEKIVRCWREPSLRDVLTTQAYALADERFRWEYVAALFEEVYSDLARAQEGREQ